MDLTFQSEFARSLSLQCSLNSDEEVQEGLRSELKEGVFFKDESDRIFSRRSSTCVQLAPPPTSIPKHLRQETVKKSGSLDCLITSQREGQWSQPPLKPYWGQSQSSPWGPFTSSQQTWIPAGQGRYSTAERGHSPFSSPPESASGLYRSRSQDGSLDSSSSITRIQTVLSVSPVHGQVKRMKRNVGEISRDDRLSVENWQLRNQLDNRQENVNRYQELEKQVASMQREVNQMRRSKELYDNSTAQLASFLSAFASQLNDTSKETMLGFRGASNREINSDDESRTNYSSFSDQRLSFGSNSTRPSTTARLSLGSAGSPIHPSFPRMGKKADSYNVLLGKSANCLVSDVGRSRVAMGTNSVRRRGVASRSHSVTGKDFVITDQDLGVIKEEGRGRSLSPLVISSTPQKDNSHSCPDISQKKCKSKIQKFLKGIKHLVKSNKDKGDVSRLRSSKTASELHRCEEGLNPNRSKMLERKRSNLVISVGEDPCESRTRSRLLQPSGRSFQHISTIRVPGT